MAQVSIGGLLNRAKRFDARLTKYYGRIRDETSDGGVRLLTYYLSRHRRHLDEAPPHLSAKAVERVRKLRMPTDWRFRPEDAFGALDAPRDVKGPELIESAIRYDTALTSLYRQIREQPVNEEAKLLVDHLIQLEERDVMMLKQMLAMRYF